MSDFNSAIEKALREEDATLKGDVTTVAGDSGGRTRFGISENNSKMPADFWTNDPQTALSQAKQFYYDKFWTPMMLSQIKDQHMATELLSFGINEGEGTAAKQLQAALVDLGLPVPVDGVIGPNTIKALMIQDVAKVATFVLIRAAFRYGVIVGQNPSQAKFADGWIHRVENES